MAKASGVAMLRPSQLKVDRDHAVQRPLSKQHVAEIAEDFSPALFGQGDVSQRADGSYYILDSQHRCAAAIVRGFGDQEFRFQVWKGLTIAEEAELFILLNSLITKNRAITAFLIGAEAKYPANVAIVKILSYYGLSVKPASENGGVSAVKALATVYDGRVTGVPLRAKLASGRKQPPGEVLSRTINILHSAWGVDRSAYDAIMINSVAALLLKHDTRIDGVRLSKLLKKNHDAMSLIGSIRSQAHARRKGTNLTGLTVMEDIYNTGLREAKRLVP